MKGPGMFMKGRFWLLGCGLFGFIRLRITTMATPISLLVFFVFLEA